MFNNVLLRKKRVCCVQPYFARLPFALIADIDLRFLGSLALLRCVRSCCCCGVAFRGLAFRGLAFRVVWRRGASCLCLCLSFPARFLELFDHLGICCSFLKQLAGTLNLCSVLSGELGSMHIVFARSDNWLLQSLCVHNLRRHGFDRCMVLERSLGVLGRLTTLSILGDLVGSWWTVELHISMLEQFRYLAECVRRQDGEVLLYENTAAEMIPRLIYRNLGSFPFRGFDWNPTHRHRKLTCSLLRIRACYQDHGFQPPFAWTPPPRPLAADPPPLAPEAQVVESQPPPSAVSKRAASLAACGFARKSALLSISPTWFFLLP